MAWLLLVAIPTGLLVLLVGLLAIPLELSGRAWVSSRQRAAAHHLELAWLFGIVSTDLSGRGEAQAPAPDLPARGEPAARARPARSGHRLAQARAVLGTPGALAALGRLVRRLVGGVHPRGLEAHLVIGTGDPAETGQLLGLLRPMAAWPGSSGRVNLDVQPAFTEPVVEGQAQGSVRTVPLALLLAVVAFSLTPATWRATWRVWRVAR